MEKLARLQLRRNLSFISCQWRRDGSHPDNKKRVHGDSHEPRIGFASLHQGSPVEGEYSQCRSRRVDRAILDQWENSETQILLVEALAVV